MKLLFIILFFLPALCFGQTTTEKIIHSKFLNQDRKIWVNTPENYELKKDSLSLVFVLDADNKTLFDYAVASKRFIENNSIDLSEFNAPESIIIGIDQQDDRFNEFITNADTFLLYLTSEVLPFIHKNYRTKNYNILIGHSLAGRFAIFSFLSKPETFNAVIAASPAFGQKNIQRIENKFDSLTHIGFTKDRALFISTTYLKNDNTEEQFREFTESLKTKFSKQEISNFRIMFDSSSSFGHGKSPYFSIPEGLHFIYDPKLWHINYDSTFDKSGKVNLAYLDKYKKNIYNLFGVTFSLNRFNNSIIYQLEQENKKAELQNSMLQMVDNNPTDLYIFGKLLSNLKKSKSGKYQTYLTIFNKTMNILKIPKEEQTERLNEIEKNSR